MDEGLVSGLTRKVKGLGFKQLMPPLFLVASLVESADHRFLALNS